MELIATEEHAAALARQMNDLTSSVLEDAHLLEQYPLDAGRHILERMAPPATDAEQLTTKQQAHQLAVNLLAAAIVLRDAKRALVRHMKEHRSSVVKP